MHETAQMLGVLAFAHLTVAAMAAALRLALSDPARLRAMGAESYRIVAEEINLERMVGVFVEVLNDLKK